MFPKGFKPETSAEKYKNKTVGENPTVFLLFMRKLHIMPHKLWVDEQGK